MSSVRSIVYASTPTRALAILQLEDLLAPAPTFELRHGVADVLLYCFFTSGPDSKQCIEGEADNVAAVDERIERSPKVQAACAFMMATGWRAVIGSLEPIEAMLARESGTQVFPEVAGA